jgi:hypothetical protein
MSHSVNKNCFDLKTFPTVWDSTNGIYKKSDGLDNAEQKKHIMAF